MAETLTQLHIVSNLEQALEVAHDIGALGIGLDVEGILTDYFGNSPAAEDLAMLPHDNQSVLQQDIDAYPGVAYCLATNNRNTTIPGQDFGMVDWVATSVNDANGEKLAMFHKGMILEDGEVVEEKPTGHQLSLASEKMALDPAEVVFIDDQGLKNTGEAVKAGVKAIIVPPPIGQVNRFHRVVEHRGVMAGRFAEPAIMRSLARNGTLAKLAFDKVAGVDSRKIVGPIWH